jgi:hypothetical protein
MTGTDERSGYEQPGYGRFGTATPGLRPSPPSLEGLLTAQQPQPGRRRLTPRRIIALAAVLAVAAGGWALGRFAFTGPPPPRLTQLTVTSVALPAGSRLSGADLRVVTVQPGAAVPPGALTPAAAGSMIGLVTRDDVPAGTFLTSSLVAPGSALPGPSQALVGLALKAGQLPAGGLAPGQQVLVVVTPVNSQGQPLSPQAVVTTAVWYLQPPDSSGTTLASVIVPSRLATRLAGYAAAGQVALVGTDHGGSGSAGTSGAGSPSGSGSTSRPGSGGGTGGKAGRGGNGSGSHTSRTKH